MRYLLAAIILVFALAETSGAKSPAQPDYKKVVKHFDGNKTIIGETIRYPSGNPVNIQSLVVTLLPGETTGWHKHGVPTYGYILSGSVTVDYGEKGKRTYRAGDAFMEAMDWWHNGSANGSEPVRILVVFMGAKGVRPVIREGAPK